MLDILLVDDDTAITRTLQLHFQDSGFRVITARDIAGAERTWSESDPDLVVLDQKLPDGSGLDLLKKRRTAGDLTPVIIITGHHEMEYAVEAMKAGAFDFIHKPLDLDELDVVIQRALTQIEYERQHHQAMPVGDSGVRIAGQSKAILEVHKQIGLAAKSKVSVLITGESGTGKELVAREIHRYSDSGQPFVAVNCSAVVPTLIESELFGYEKGAFTGAHERREGKLSVAGQGTLFLDEIGDLAPDLQAKLLRVLQERTFTRVGGHTELPFRARVIAATNRNLRAMIAEGTFREDLFFRLNVFEIRMPALRERPSDIPLIAAVLLEKISRDMHARATRISAADMARLVGYRWPGNIRELENVLTQSLIHSPGNVLNLVFTPLPEAAGTTDGKMVTLEEMEKQHIARVLRWSGGHLGKACQLLGISRPTLRKKLQEYGLEVPEKE
ncbi:MAG: sigma-54-dependent Fis family transcriptional regulator [Candidatus Zixiibacteriota bacterium]|nr:MAG: sigma-54-dependent Fis family transcriptional regulator [candidate division Zixibacteria bacterium]